MKSKDNKEISSAWFDVNFDIETRTVYVGSVNASSEMEESGVDNFMAESVIKAIHVLQNISDEPITFIMNNPGGSWYHGMAIYDAIRSTPCVTIMIVYGHAMSMGSIILQAADYRIMMPNAKMMIHYGYEGFFGHAKTNQKWADEGKKIGYQMENIYLESMIAHDQEMGKETMESLITDIMNYQRSFEYPRPEDQKIEFSEDLEKRIEEYRVILKEMLNTDTILTAQETIALGFADDIYQYPEKSWHHFEKMEEAKAPKAEKKSKKK
jgi:ATP-dependent protease ClpP protease subunit